VVISSDRNADCIPWISEVEWHRMLLSPGRLAVRSQLASVECLNDVGQVLRRYG